MAQDCHDFGLVSRELQNKHARGSRGGLTEDVAAPRQLQLQETEQLGIMIITIQFSIGCFR